MNGVSMNGVGMASRGFKTRKRKTKMSMPQTKKLWQCATKRVLKKDQT